MHSGIDSFDKYLSVFISKFYFGWDPMDERQQLNATISKLRDLNNKLNNFHVVSMNAIEEVRADKGELEGTYRLESQKISNEMKDLEDANVLLSKRSKMYESLYREASEERRNMEVEIEMPKKRNDEGESMVKSMHIHWNDAEQNIRNVLNCTSNMIKYDDQT